MNISKANYLLLLALIVSGCQTVKQTEISNVNHQITLAKKIMDAEVDLKMKEPVALAEASRQERAAEALHKREIALKEAELNFKLEQMKLEIEKNKPKPIKTLSKNKLIFNIEGENESASSVESTISKMMINSGYVKNVYSGSPPKGSISVNIKYTLMSSIKDKFNDFHVYNSIGDIKLYVQGKNANFMYATEEFSALGDRAMNSDDAKLDSIKKISSLMGQWVVNTTDDLYSEYQSKLRMDQISE